MGISSLSFVKSPGGRVAIEDQGMSTGSRFYVDSVNGASGNPGTSPDKAVATLDQGNNLCTANKGDIIYLMPNHAETFSGAGVAGATMDIAGVTVIGLGSGTDRPTITFDTNIANDLECDAANVIFKNVVFIADIDNLTAPIDVDAANFRMINCEFRDDTAAKQTARWILGDANADFMQIIDCLHKGSDTAGAVAFITLNGADHVEIRGCSSHGDFSAANIEVITAACTDLLIDENWLENANAVDVNIELFAACTGWVSYNRCRIATNTELTWINTPGNVGLFENYGVNDNGETGKLIGTVSTS